MVAVFAPAQRKDIPLAPQKLTKEYEAAVAEVDHKIEKIRDEIKQIQKLTRERLLEGKYKKLPEPVQIAIKTPAEQRTEAQKLQAEQAKYSIGVSEAEIGKELSPEDKKKIEPLEASVAALEKSKPSPLPLAQGVMEPGSAAAPSFFLHRGSTQSKGSEMAPGVLSVLHAPGAEPVFPAPASDSTSTQRRLTLANWIASPANPLTARVMINRIWQHHFGRGLVGTPNDYGRMGEKPTHPELLDWLATEFVRQGWSVKAMHRLIVTSRTYQQASWFTNEANSKKDPENHLLWKMPLQRLEGEAVRDSILTVAGSLNLKMGGPGIFPEVDPEILRGAAYQVWPKTTDGPEMWRRSVYITQMRSITAPILDLFDPPDSISSCARRNVTTVAPQALQLLNNRFVTNQSEIFAERLMNEMGRDLTAQIDRGFRLALGRAAEPREAKAALLFAERQREFHRQRRVELEQQGVDPAEISAPDKAALIDFCHALINLNEFVYVN